MQDRWHNKVEKTATCWVWMGSLDSHGYGQFWDGKRTVLAHRFAYSTYTGRPLTRTEFVCHKCDNAAANWIIKLQNALREEKRLSDELWKAVQYVPAKDRWSIPDVAPVLWEADDPDYGLTDDNL